MKIPGVVLTDLDVHGDHRGGLAEIYSDENARFLQANHTRSKAGVLRGLHFHRRQSDLWFVTAGKLQVALVDLRTPAEPPISLEVELDAEVPQTLLIPPGVAHGALSLSDSTLIYFLTSTYDPGDEFGVAWNDPTIGFPWRIDEPLLSQRDKDNPLLRWEDIPSFS